MQQRAVGLEERMARLEGILEEVRTRLNSLEQRMDAGFRELRVEIARLEARQDRLLWGMLAILLPMWVTIILTVLFAR